MFVTAYCLHFVHFLTPQIRVVVCLYFLLFFFVGDHLLLSASELGNWTEEDNSKCNKSIEWYQPFNCIKFTQRPNFRGNIYLFWQITKEIWVKKSSDNDVRLQLLCRKHLLDNFQMLSLHTRTVHLLNSLRSNGNYAGGGGASYRTIRVQLAICKCKRSGEHSKFPH